MKRRNCRLADVALVVLIVSSSAACTSKVPVPAPLEPRSEVVEARLASPRTVEARRPDGSSVGLHELTSARGRVTEVRGDSLVMQIESWSSEGMVEHREKPSLTATLGSAESAIRTYERQFSIAKTLLLLGLVVGLAALSVGQATIMA